MMWEGPYIQEATQKSQLTEILSHLLHLDSGKQWSIFVMGSWVDGYGISLLKAGLQLMDRCQMLVQRKQGKEPRNACESNDFSLMLRGVLFLVQLRLTYNCPLKGCAAETDQDKCCFCDWYRG